MDDLSIKESEEIEKDDQHSVSPSGQQTAKKPARRGARCPQCGKFVWISLGRRKPAPQPGNWRIGWVNGSLQVGKVGVPGWLGPWRKIVGTTGGIVPPESVLGAAVLRLDGVLRRNGFYVLGANGKYRRAGKADLYPSTSLGKRRLDRAGWPHA